MLDGLLQLRLQILTQLVLALRCHFRLLVGFKEFGSNFFVDSLHVDDLHLKALNLLLSIVQLLLDSLSLISTPVLLCETLIVCSVVLFELSYLKIELLHLFSECRLDRIRINEALDLLLREQELVLDQSLHVRIALDDRFEQLREISPLRLLTFGLVLSRGRVDTWLISRNLLEVVPRWEIAWRVGQELINLLLYLHYLRRGINNIAVVATSAWINLQICPNDSLFVEEAGQDLLQELVFHVEDFRDNLNLVTAFALLTQIGHLLLHELLLQVPARRCFFFRLPLDAMALGWWEEALGRGLNQQTKLIHVLSGHLVKPVA